MSRTRSIAFVIPHPYVDALACFREPIAALADAGWQVDLYTTLSPLHPAPFFGRDRVRLIPFTVTPRGALALVGGLARRRPRYDWIVTVPQWGLYYASIASRLAGIPLGVISDEMTADAEATTAVKTRWRERECRAHQRCAFTIALSEARGAFVRAENRLGAAHRIFVVPNSAPGPAARLRSHFYPDMLDLAAGRFLVLHSGSWWWKLEFASVGDVAREWDEDTTLVFQGRLVDPQALESSARVRVSPAILPASLLDYATSSAHVGLALYQPTIANNREMGTASGKIALYMKNLLPVITTAQPSLAWIEEDGCGVCVNDVAEIPAAVRRIRARYDEYCDNVARTYDRRLDFTRAFEPVMAFLERP